MDTIALKLGALFVTCFIVAACSELPSAAKQVESPPPEVPKPGKKLAMAPERAWESENCESRPLPYLRLEQSELTAPTVTRGNSIIYRFPYTACVPAQPGYILGRFRTTISLAGKALSTRSDDTFPVETGKWIVDTDIAVPKDAEPGVYSLEATLAAKGVTIQDRLNFIVQP
jgi:hypothetical protein